MKTKHSGQTFHRLFLRRLRLPRLQPGSGLRGDCLHQGGNAGRCDMGRAVDEHMVRRKASLGCHPRRRHSEPRQPGLTNPRRLCLLSIGLVRLTLRQAHALPFSDVTCAILFGFVILVIGSLATAEARSISVNEFRVVDGDTIHLLSEDRATRLVGFNAPRRRRGRASALTNSPSAHWRPNISRS